MTGDEVEELVRRCLTSGVPSGIVADVFEINRDVVDELRRQMLVIEYGTADQAEYLEWLQWRTLDRCQWIVDHGSPADVTKIATAVLSRQLVTQGKRLSEGHRQRLDKLADRMTQMREGTGGAEAPGEFVVAGATEDD